MIKVGDKITLCAVCFILMDEVQAKRLPCPSGRKHVIVTAVCTAAPPEETVESTAVEVSAHDLSPAEKLNENLAPGETPYRDTQFGPTNRPMGNTD